jgi:hypothetical protein
MSPSLFLAKHSPVIALAERTHRWKPEPQRSAGFSANPTTDVAVGVGSKRCLVFAGFRALEI